MNKRIKNSNNYIIIIENNKLYIGWKNDKTKDILQEKQQRRNNLKAVSVK